MGLEMARIPIWNPRRFVPRLFQLGTGIFVAWSDARERLALGVDVLFAVA
jgi:hypothetical protein